MTEVRREDFSVTTRDGVRVFVRAVTAGQGGAAAPLLLVHGARVPGLGSFDLPVAGGSLAADLAQRTARPVFVMDARNYGGSDRNAAMAVPPEANPPQSRAVTVVRDIAAVAADAARRTGAGGVALLGWATGGMWAGFFASLYPERVSHLVALNALYGGSDRHAMLERSADPAHPERLSPTIGAYGLNSATALLPGWDGSIPLADKAAWRDPAVAEAYVAAALASDPHADRRDPPAFRAPLGAIEDSFYQARGRRLFDAGSITAALLLVRGERDFWSRPEDVAAFARDAVRARRVATLTLPEATHFVHLDRPERGRTALLDAVVEFLQA
jgi:pimeloyl-ACP methyl ester carboxylesterase